MDHTVQDLRQAVRLLVKSPTFTAVAVVTLALGVGANTAVFTVANAVLFRPLPYREPAQLVQLWNEFQGTNLERVVFSHLEFQDYRARSRRLEGLGAYGQNTHTVKIGGEPEQMWIASVSTNLFDLLGASPALGRGFSEEESRPGNDDVVVISHGLWQQRFGGDPAVLSATISVEGRPHAIVGVMPPSFRFLLRQPEIWKPIAFGGALMEEANRGSRSLWVVGRMRDGVTAADARGELDDLARQLAAEHPGQYTPQLGHTVVVVPLHEQVTGRAQRGLGILLGAAGLVLLIACANVANLLLARATIRQREIAMRSALGASRRRLLQQLLTESLVLGVAGGLAGTLIGAWGVDLLLRQMPAGTLPRMNEIAVTGGVLWYSLGLSLLTAVLFGVAPALLLSSTDLAAALKTSGPLADRSSKGRLRSLLVVGEVAVSVVLVIGAGLMLRSFAHLLGIPPGFNPERALTLQLSLPQARYETRAQQIGFYGTLGGRLVNVPGVRSVGLVTSLPFSGWRNDWSISLEGAAGQAQAAGAPTPAANYFAVNADYFGSMEIPVRQGRMFTAADARGDPVVVVNQTLARRFWPDQDPIGRRLKMGGVASPWPWRTVVGVVGDVRQSDLETAVMPEIFVPYDDERKPFAPSMFVVLRTMADPAGLSGAVRTEVAALDSDLATANIRTLAERVSLTLAERRYQVLLFVLFGGLALVLAGVGVYGVIAYLVSQRTREIGLRVALGARTRDLYRMVLRYGLGLAGAGIGLGLVGALALTRFQRALLYEIEPTDPVTFVLVTVTLVAVAVAASAIPARRATRVEPMTAMRAE